MRQRLLSTTLVLATFATLPACLQIGPDADSSEGDGDDATPVPFDGIWVREVSGCWHFRHFGRHQETGELAYEIGLACPLTSGAVGHQTESGTFNYFEESGTTTFTPTTSTCAGTSSVPFNQKIRLNGTTTLVAETGNGTEVFFRDVYPVGSDAVLGCFDVHGGFVPAPISKL